MLYLKFVTRHLTVNPVYSVSVQGKKPRHCTKRFVNPTVKNIQSGVLLSRGPIATYKTVQNLSRVFHSAVTKQKFIAAGEKLHEFGFGSMVILEDCRNSHVFVKKSPQEMQGILGMTGSDLCTFEEYGARFEMDLPSAVGQNILDSLTGLGYISVKEKKIKYQLL